MVFGGLLFLSIIDAFSPPVHIASFKMKPATLPNNEMFFTEIPCE